LATPTAREQLMLELVNRARLDPAAEAARFKIKLNQGLDDGTLNAKTKAPLAMNGLLIDAARDHSEWMLDTDTFSHTGQGGSSAGDRMEDAGYVFSGAWTWGENISWRGTSGAPNLTAFIVEQHKSLFLSPGHRTNILNADFREIGVGQQQGEFDGFNASMVTQKFAATGTARFLTGVVYDDKSGDDFYSVGEGDGGVRVGVGGKATSSNAVGGYQVKVGSGTVKVTFGTGVDAVQVNAVLRAENAKIDLVDGDSLFSSVTLKLVKNAKAATLLGLNDLNLTGGAAAETLTGNKGANKIAGGGGGDRLFGVAGNDTLDGGDGKDVLNGGAGRDVLAGGRGADKLTGGADADVFLFRKLVESTPGAAGRDTILDFKRGQGDKISLKAIDARADIKKNQAFSFIERDAFSGKSGELRYGKDGKHVIVQGDVDGDRVADFAIKIASVSTLVAGDFIL
jgi:Ca2+-binding RTX toxin-like protein